ncbi:MAG: transcription initiation factor TFIID subunit TAF1 [Amphiamblys sp. WSBS2006]|nr:MAG: transcription initiation factor TFIID subunit TAF1 [Amphiamblys sp. WSBS2006]
MDVNDLLLGTIGLGNDILGDGDEDELPASEGEAEERARPMPRFTRLFHSKLFLGTKQKHTLRITRNTDIPDRFVDALQRRPPGSGELEKKTLLQRALEKQNEKKEKRKRTYQTVFGAYCSGEACRKKRTGSVQDTEYSAVDVTDWENSVLWSEADAQRELENRPLLAPLYTDLPDTAERARGQRLPSSARSTTHRSILSSLSSIAAHQPEPATEPQSTQLAQNISRLLQMPQSMQNKTLHSITAALADQIKRRRVQNEHRMNTALQNDIQTTLAAQIARPDLASPGESSPPATEDRNPSVLKNRQSIAARIKNRDVEMGAWVDGIIWDECTPPKSLRGTRLIIDMNDPFMFIDTIGIKEIETGFKEAARIIHRKTEEDHSRPILDRLNLSNDRYYIAAELCKTASFAQNMLQKTTLQHKQCALGLSPLHFKTKLSKKDCGAWHRPELRVPTEKITFAPGGSTSDTDELSLAGNTRFITVEHSSQYPLLVSNTGMGSLLTEYYRKTHPEDPHTPASEHASAVAFDSTTFSPFGAVGTLEPGEEMTALSNNMMTCPVFKTPHGKTDFLVCRTPSDGNTATLRELDTLYIAGNIIPFQPAYRPNSKEATTFLKDRIRMAIYNTAKTSRNGKIKLQRVFDLFPTPAHNLIRAVAKELLVADKRGQKDKLYTVKEPVPADEVLRSLVTPERACLYESVCSAAQREKTIALFEKYTDNNIRSNLVPWVASKHICDLASSTKRLTSSSNIHPFSLGNLPLPGIEEKIASVMATPNANERTKAVTALLWNSQKRWLRGEEPPKTPPPERDAIAPLPERHLVIRRATYTQEGVLEVTEEEVTDPLVVELYLNEKNTPQKKTKWNPVVCLKKSSCKPV